MKNKLWTGIDVSKDWIDVGTVDQQGHLSEKIQRYGNDYMSFAMMVKRQEQQYQVDGKQILFCFENTGRYSKLLAAFLSEHGYCYREEAGLQIKLSSGMQRGTTDQKAAQQIALYAYRRRDELVEHKVRSKHIQGLADLLAYRRRLLKAIHLFEVSAQQLKQVSLSACDQVIQSGNDQLLKHINEQLAATEEDIRKLIDEHEELSKNDKLAQSVKGIGPWITAYLLVYTNNFTAFDFNWRKFACYIATAPFQKSSGKQIGVARTNKMGCKIVKAYLTMGARSAIQHDKQIRAFAIRKEAEGKHYFQIENAVKNKLLARVFAVVKRQTPYVELMA